MAVAKPKLIAAVAGVAVLVAGGAGWMLLGGKHDAPAGATAGGPGGGGPGAGGPGGGPGGRMGGRATDVVAVPVAIQAFSGKIEALGTLEPRERVDLTANAADRVTGVFFEDGRRVAKGATLMTLASEEEHAQLESAKASQADALRIYERNKRLAEDGAISSKEFETSKANAEAAAGSVGAIEARIRDRVLIAPFSGVLGFRKISNGAYVSPGQVVATLIDDSEMRLEFGVPSVHISTLKVGLPITAQTNDVAGVNFTGKLTSIDNAIDPVTRSVKVRATLPNRDGKLRPGMFMTVELMPSSRNSLAVPEISIVAEGPQTFVYLVAEAPAGARGPGAGAGEGGGKPPAGAKAAGGQKPGAGGAPGAGGPGAGGPGAGGGKPMVAKKVAVTVGARERGTVEILSGLKSGDRVVTDGILKMRPDAPIKVKASDEMPVQSGEARVASGDGPSAKADLRQ